jgi:hypothetical protein
MTKIYKKNNKTRKINKNKKNSYSFEKEITIKFLELLIMVKLYHWKTYSYATHKVTDELYSKLNENIDRFIEVLMGKTDTHIDLKNQKFLPIYDLHTVNELAYKITQFKTYLVDLNNNGFMKKMNNADLFTIRDEILADLNQFLYLLSLK